METSSNESGHGPAWSADEDTHRLPAHDLELDDAARLQKFHHELVRARQEASDQVAAAAGRGDPIGSEKWRQAASLLEVALSATRVEIGRIAGNEQLKAALLSSMEQRELKPPFDLQEHVQNEATCSGDDEITQRLPVFVLSTGDTARMERFHRMIARARREAFDGAELAARRGDASGSEMWLDLAEVVGLALDWAASQVDGPETQDA